MIEQATVHLPLADRDTNPPVSIYLVHLSSFFGAAAARVGSFPLLAVLIYVADEHPAVYARAGAQALEASIVSL
jgi:hypothetical protein